MLKSFLFLATVAVIISCKQKKIPPAELQNDNNKGNFFPVTEYLLGQIKELETLPQNLLKITTINGGADSAWIKSENARMFMQPFIYPAIDSINYHSYFSEKSFLDRTLNAFTFSYDPIRPLPHTMAVKRWDVYVDPDTHKVNRVYIVKQLITDTSVLTTLQLTWKPGNYCRVTTITERKGENPKIKQEKLVWNFND